MRRLASAAALFVAIIVATPADAGDYRRHAPGWGYAPGWHHRPPPPPHWHRPYRQPPPWLGWHHDRPRQDWRQHRHAWGPHDRW